MTKSTSRQSWPGPKTRGAMTPQNGGGKPLRREEILEAEAHLVIDGQEGALDDGYRQPGKHDKPRCRRRDTPRKTQVHHHHRG